MTNIDEQGRNLRPCGQCSTLKKERDETVKRGRYFKSEREYMNARGQRVDRNRCPSIHASGSVKGMRKQFWGYECDVVRIGNHIYKVS